MRRPVDADRVRALMTVAVGLGAERPLKLEPESDRLLRALSALEERLEMNLELAAPDQFIPEIPGWRERSPFVAREGRLDFHRSVEEATAPA